MHKIIAAGIASSVLLLAASAAHAQGSANTCLAVNNMMSEPIWVEVEGIPQTFWSMAHAEMTALKRPLPDGRTVRGASFVLLVYAANGSGRGNLIERSESRAINTPHTSWISSMKGTDINPKWTDCDQGVVVAAVH
jgi:hypothetical protein